MVRQFEDEVDGACQNHRTQYDTPHPAAGQIGVGHLASHPDSERQIREIW
jgi:hypothetical protein